LSTLGALGGNLILAPPLPAAIFTGLGFGFGALGGLGFGRGLGLGFTAGLGFLAIKSSIDLLIVYDST